MKKFNLLITLLITSCFMLKVNAGDASISASSRTVTVGSSVGITIRTTNLWGTYSLISSNNNILAGEKTSEIEVNNFVDTVYFKANSVGTTSIIFKPVDKNYLCDPTNDSCWNGTKSVTITVVPKNTPPSIDVNPTYSSNNYLKDLNIEGYELNPKFDKNTLEYSLTVEDGLDKIKINATKEDNKATVKGAGEVSLTEGINTINVVVAAENGNERTYKLTITVPEKDPIKVKIGDSNYTVVKRKELLKNMDGYEATTVKINNFDIPAFYNSITDVTLIGLKDEKGNISMFAYDSNNDKYYEYKEFKFDVMNLYIHENKNSKYESVTININDEEVPAYKIDGVDDYYLLYATNTFTGYEGYYLYDTKENSVQRYDSTMLDRLTQEKDKYLSLTLVLSSVCFLMMLFMLIKVNSDNKKMEN